MKRLVLPLLLAASRAALAAPVALPAEVPAGPPARDAFSYDPGYDPGRPTAKNDADNSDAGNSGPASEATRPYDAENYELGYEVYLNNGNVAAAYRLAETAVAARPQDLAWRRRLAQVAEWQGQPLVALQNWLQLAEQGGDADAWAAVGRLAPALHESEAELAFRRWQVQQQPGDRARLAALIGAYEAVGRPRDGIVLLQTLAAQQPGRELYEALAGLAERDGDSDTALAALHILRRDYPPLAPDWPLRAANLQYQRGELQAAWQELASAAPAMPPAAPGFWQAYGNLSFMLGEEDAARAAYAAVVQDGHFSDTDLDRYAAFLASREPADAARLQALRFQRFGSREAVPQALYLWQRAGDSAAADAFLQTLTPAQLASLEQDSGFRESRGDLRAAEGRWQEAMADYRAGLALAPGDGRLRQSWMGLVIEHGDPAELRRLLQEGVSTAAADPAQARLWASGWQRLGQPEQALPYLQMAYEKGGQQALDGLLYAQALAEAGYPDPARALQARFWREREAALARVGAEDRAALREALLALELQWLPVDARQARLSALFNASSPDEPLQPWLREQLLDEAAADPGSGRLRYLVQRKLQGQPLPAWPRATLALAGDDHAALARLLARERQALPPEQQAEVAQRLDKPALALRLAYAGAEQQPDDPDVQQVYTDLAVQQAGSVGLTLQRDKLDGLTRTPVVLDWQGRQRGPWRWQALLEAAGLDAGAGLQQLPASTQQYAELGVAHELQRWRWQLALSWLDSLDSVPGLRGELRLPAGAGRRATLAAGWQQRSQATAGLSAAGLHDYAAATLDWSLGSRDSLQLGLEYDRFSAQTGEALGDNSTASASWTHELTASAYGWRLQAGVVANSAQVETALPASLQPLLGPDATPDDLVPGDFTQGRFALAVGEGESRYRAHWQPFAEAGLSYDDTGAGYDYRAGLAGPALGRDQLRFFIEGAQGAQSNAETRQRISLDYRMLY